MDITRARYDLVKCNYYIIKPFPVVSETEKCYWSGEKCGVRILKEEVGKVKHLSTTSYPYLEVAMIDATETELKEKLAEWFEQKANKIRN